MKRAAFLLAAVGSAIFLQTPLWAADTQLSLVAAAYSPSTKRLNQPDFILRNDGGRPALFQVTVRLRGVTKAVLVATDGNVAVWPQQLLLLPGQRKTISLEAKSPVAEEAHYDVFVEQLPVLFGPPGDTGKDQFMTVKRFVASVSVRPGGGAQTILASNTTDILP